MQVSFTHIHPFLVKELALVWHQKGITHKLAHWKGKEKNTQEILILLQIPHPVKPLATTSSFCEWLAGLQRMEQFLDGASIMTFFQLAIGKELLSLISDVFVYENFSIIKYAGPIADMCGATWSQELADLVPGRGLWGQGGTTTFCIFMVVGRGYEVFWNTLVFYIKQIIPTPCFKAFENISTDTALTATQST